MRRYSTLFHPRSADVGLVDDGPVAITLTLGDDFEVELWPRHGRPPRAGGLAGSR